MAELGSAKVTDNSLNKLKSIELENPRKESSGRGLAGSALRLNTSGKSLLNGIIMAEVLGKPRCLRRGHR